jgi:hypothetical protein
MRSRAQGNRLLRLGLAVLAALVVLSAPAAAGAAGGAEARAQAAGDRCPFAAALPGQAAPEQVRVGTLCLMNTRQVALTTGNKTWDQGLDVVVEGTAVRVADRDALQRLADAYEAKYGSDWHFDVGDGVFGTGEDAAAAFRIEPIKVLAFAKDPHAQTTYRFTAR